MTVLLEYWDLILLLVLLLIFGILRLIKLLKTPTQKRQELLLMWLVQAVSLAEKQFGEKTGSLKISFVYDLFIRKYGVLGKFVSRELFETLVDRAIRIMEETLNEEMNKLPK